MKELALFVTRDSETLFYELLASNSEIPIKQLCRKISRKMLYKYLRQLKQVQDSTGMDIFQKSAAICSITGLPNTIIKRNCCIEVEQTAEGSALVTLCNIP